MQHKKPVKHFPIIVDEIDKYPINPKFLGEPLEEIGKFDLASYKEIKKNYCRY